jgi:hAT family C-terminal dimerisation region
VNAIADEAGNGRQQTSVTKTYDSQPKRSLFATLMSSNITLKDEFDAYLAGPLTASLIDENRFTWFANSGSTQLTPMAFDILSIPAMSAETERIFSDTKLTISANRNRLGEDIIEATECMN